MKQRWRSLKFKMGLFFLLLAASLVVLIGYNNFRAMDMMRTQTYETIGGTVNMQRGRLSDSLDTVEAHLSLFINDNAGISVLERDDRRSQAWFSALYRLQKSFDDAVTVQLAEDFFLYVPASGTFICKTAGVSQSMRGSLAAAIDEGEYFTDENQSKWLAMEVEGTNYLTRVLRVRSSYIGAVVSVDGALKAMFGSAGQGHYFDLAARDGTLLRTGAPMARIENYTGADADSLRTIRMEGGPQILIARQVPGTNLDLVALVPDTALETTTLYFRSIMLAVLLGLVAVLAASYAVFQRWVMRPVGALTTAIRKLKSGDLDARVDGADYSTEFDDMNQAFNDMVSEISDLTIDVYEEQLQRQHTEIEYLKLQVTPHFLINCLNTVYQLTDAGKPELTQRMVRDLSQHLRYLLNSGASVPLGQELELVENFIELSSIRYPGCIRLELDVDEAAKPTAADATAIPLLVLNFIENTIKYEVEVGKLVEIHVAVRRVAAGGIGGGKTQDAVHIEIWDTGRGFSPDMLGHLQNLDTFIKKHRGRHIGISNVFQRARLILGEGCVFRFQNRPGAGAQIDIHIPYIPYHGGGSQNEAADC